jgi:apolipoprotein N-acyltransferase
MTFFLLPLLSALLLYLASPGPGLAVLAWIALTPLLLFCRQTTPGRAALGGLAAGTLYHLLLVYWVTISMETYGGLSPLVSWPALLLLALYMALYVALFCFLTSRVRSSGALLCLAPLLWVGLDLCRGIFLTGFPWMDLGYSQYRYPLLIQAADLVGHHGITFMLVLTSALLAHFLPLRPWSGPDKKTAAAAAVFFALFLGYSALRLAQVKTAMATSPSLQVAVVQANIDQTLKWRDNHKIQSLERHLALTRQVRAQQGASLVIWPETALAFYPDHDPLMAQVEEQTVRAAPFHLLTGAPHVALGKVGYDYYNSALLLGPRQEPDIYFKQHLVPFGEYIPLRAILPIPKPIVETLGDFSAGTSSRPLDMGSAQLGVLICIEAIYPALARRTTAQGATLLTNITNDAWFGASSAPVQHLAMAIFRSVENRRSMARAANTGISALILPSGEVLRQSELFTATALSAALPLLTATSFFTRAGFVFPFLCLAGALAILIASWKNSGPPAK